MTQRDSQLPSRNLPNGQEIAYAQQATPRHWKEQFAAVQQALARLAADLASAELDVLIIIGDDQLELFSFANMPALAIFYGEKITSGLWTSRFGTYQRQGRSPTAPLSERLQRAVKEGYAMDAHREFASAPSLRARIARILNRPGLRRGRGGRDSLAR